MFEAKVIAHSVHQSKEILTVQLCYPRFIHGEVLTHRVFSRNSMSSRAIPVAKMIDQVRSSPATPVFWGANQPGMQAAAELEEHPKSLAQDIWAEAAAAAAKFAERFEAVGLHKQIANRVLEPFQWMRTIVTATEWDNFYALRCHKDAQPEFQHLANLMRQAHQASRPQRLPVGAWHLPYVLPQEHGTMPLAELRKVSAARCARVSYLTHEGKSPDLAADLALFDRLAAGVPIHASPLEHQATPYGLGSGNFKGWMQFRHVWENRV